MLGQLHDVVVGSGAHRVGGEHQGGAGHVIGSDFRRRGFGRGLSAADQAGLLVVTQGAGVEINAAHQLGIRAAFHGPAAQSRVDFQDGVVVLDEGLGDLIDHVLIQILAAEDAVGAAGESQLFGLALEGVGGHAHAGEALLIHEPVDQLVAPLQERHVNRVGDLVHGGGSGGSVVDVEVDLSVLDGRLVGVAALVGDTAAPALQLVLGHAEVLKQLVGAFRVHGAHGGAADAQGQLLLEDLLDGRDAVLLQEVVADAVDVAGSGQAAQDGSVAAGGLFAQGAGLLGPLGGSAVDEGQVHALAGEQIGSAHAAGVGGLHVHQAEAAVVLQVLGQLHNVVVGSGAHRVRGEHQGGAGEVFRFRRRGRSRRIAGRGSGGCSGSSRSRGSGGFRRRGTAGRQTDDHHDSQDQCQSLFHADSFLSLKFIFILFRFFR